MLYPGILCYWFWSEKVEFFKLHGSDGKNSVLIDVSLDVMARQADLHETCHFDCTLEGIDV